MVERRLKERLQAGHTLKHGTVEGVAPCSSAFPFVVVG